MPKLVSELAQGNAFGRSSDGGGLADRATRKWKILLNSPDENWDPFAASGVNIGDIYSTANPIPCVSVEGQHDGDSRMVIIVTAEYRSSPSAAPDQPDPKTQEPTIRPAMYSMTTTLTEIASWAGKRVVGGVSSDWRPAVNPVGDMYDGVARLEPVVNITIDQYSRRDQSNLLAFTGYVNSDALTFSALPIAPHCCMLQSISSTPVVENFNGALFRGFKISFVFAVRAHWSLANGIFEPIGWDVAVPQTGFNIKNTGLGRSDVDQKALVLEHKYGRVAEDPIRYAEGTSGIKTRGMVTVPATGSETGGYVQRPCAQPIPLNNDGSPRNTDNFTNIDKVIINRVCLQPEMVFGTNFAAFGINSIA